MVINRSHNQGRIPPLDTLSSNGFDSIKIAKCAIFSTNFSISCDMRALFLLGRCAKGKQTRNYFHKRMNKFNFCYHSLVWIWGKTLGITSLTITLNMRTVNVILIMLITVVRVFLTNPDARDIRNVVRRISRSDETKKKSLPERGGWKQLTWQQQIIMSGAYDGLLIMSNFPQIHLWIHDKYSSTSFKQRPPAELRGKIL